MSLPGEFVTMGTPSVCSEDRGRCVDTEASRTLPMDETLLHRAVMETVLDLHFRRASRAEGR